MAQVDSHYGRGHAGFPMPWAIAGRFPLIAKSIGAEVEAAAKQLKLSPPPEMTTPFPGRDSHR
ncbi:hypothetical protein [Candidatus Binatus sp.]|uniref:hypothetical protein n=1 Tax=Candidatus Binatus sp. TaxID=2811406 RepID=UPI003C542E3C